jgi:hypothetical protein
MGRVYKWSINSFTNPNPVYSAPKSCYRADFHVIHDALRRVHTLWNFILISVESLWALQPGAGGGSGKHKLARDCSVNREDCATVKQFCMILHRLDLYVSHADTLYIPNISFLPLGKTTMNLTPLHSTVFIGPSHVRGMARVNFSCRGCIKQG